MILSKNHKILVKSVPNFPADGTEIFHVEIQDGWIQYFYPKPRTREKAEELLISIQNRLNNSETVFAG